MTFAALVSLPVGVIVERRKAESPWLDYTWSVVDVCQARRRRSLDPCWIESGHQPFLLGSSYIHLHRMEASNYRDNLLSGSPSLWVVLRSTGGRTALCFAYRHGRSL